MRLFRKCAQKQATMKYSILTKLTLIGLLALAQSREASAQGSAFSYQGRLSDGGAPANGVYDFMFTLNDSADPTTVFIAWVGLSGVPVSNGLFNVTLNFPGQQFNSGQPRWLEVYVQKSGDTNGMTPLLPRQQVLPTPYAITAANLAGALPDSQLSSNVARLNSNQVFTGTNSFVGGNVGIGTNNPTTKLDVAGAVAINGTTIIDASGNWVGATAGLNLNTLRSGASVPLPTLGANGDFYINTATWRIYGPKAGLNWGSGASMIGATGPQGVPGPQGATGAQGPQGLQGPAGPPSGTAVLNGSGPPAPYVGTNGDFYIDTSAHAVYGPKTSGAWGNPTSLVGPQGPIGPQGPVGAPGINSYALCFSSGGGGGECAVACGSQYVQSGVEIQAQSGQSASCTATSTTGSCTQNITSPGSQVFGACCVCKQH
jgi:hypothetical protein